MKKATVAIQIVLSLGIGLVINFFTLRAVIRKLNKPQDKRQQSRLAAILAVLLAVPSVIRIRQLVELAKSEPVNR